VAKSVSDQDWRLDGTVLRGVPVLVIGVAVGLEQLVRERVRVIEIVEVLDYEVVGLWVVVLDLDSLGFDLCSA